MGGVVVVGDGGVVIFVLVTTQLNLSTINFLPQTALFMLSGSNNV